MLTKKEILSKYLECMQEAGVNPNIFDTGVFKNNIMKTDTFDKNYSEDLNWQFVING